MDYLVSFDFLEDFIENRKNDPNAANVNLMWWQKDTDPVISAFRQMANLEVPICAGKHVVKKQYF